jgi:protein-S-isoprenylcysteine O-methyltransferase Ste14
MSSKIGSFSGFAIAVIGLVYLIFNNYIITKNPVIIIIQLLSFCLMIWARRTFRSRSFHLTADPTEGGLVTRGPYRWLRHPIYVAIIYFSWACLIAFPKTDAFMAVILITAGLFTRMILEEKELIKAYPEYEEYSKRAKRLIPFIF